MIEWEGVRRGCPPFIYVGPVDFRLMLGECAGMIACGA